jgi:hypothetical protein
MKWTSSSLGSTASDTSEPLIVIVTGNRPFCAGGAGGVAAAAAGSSAVAGLSSPTRMRLTDDQNDMTPKPFCLSAFVDAWL